MQVSVQNSIPQTDISYLPLNEVENLLQSGIQLPYSVKFSLKPYLKLINQKMPNACPNTKMALTPVLEKNEDYIESDEKNFEELIKHNEFRTLLSMAVPSMLYDNELSYISSPFKKDFVVQTPAFLELFQSDEWELKINPDMLIKGFNKTIQQAGIRILNKHYDQNIKNVVDEILTIRHKKSKIEKHFRINLRFDFIDVIAKKEIPKLNKAQIKFLLNNLEDHDLWTKMLPSDVFEFCGFTIGNLYDITDIQVLSEFKNWLSSNVQNEMTADEYFKNLTVFIKSYLQLEDLNVGGFVLDKDPLFKDGNKNVLEAECLSELLIPEGNDGIKGIYDHLYANKRVMFIDDLNQLENPSIAEQRLLKKGVQSYVLSPMLDDDSNIISVLELSSPVPNAFNFQNVPKLQPIFEQLIFSFEKFTIEMNNRITNLIQKNFTSIHPSVKWKFEDVTKTYYRDKINNVSNLTIAPIVFNNVYPLYGQSDIVHSSTLRNEAIQADLLENLNALDSLLEVWTNQMELHLLDSYKFRIKDLINHLKEAFISTDESRIVKMITEEIHPLLEQTIYRYPKLSKEAYKKYKSILDSDLHIVYHKRKDFEQSVTMLNSQIADFMESDEAKMQKVLPHFFEKYKTDGVEYNIYVGQSILKEGQFNQDDLKNFRLWQLVNSCEVTRLVKNIGPSLPMPLTTAELIFVYNNSLSIRFRMDEKKFDVDGAYNVRYEILKKRIDKATIKGTGERLTISGKVAIVYLSANDKAQYLEFFDYLKSKDLIEDQIEDLELDKLQGADGLRALRITVKQLENAKP